MNKKKNISEYSGDYHYRTREENGRHTRDTSYSLSHSRQVNSALKLFSHRKRFLATFIRQFYTAVFYAARKFISRTKTAMKKLHLFLFLSLSFSLFFFLWIYFSNLCMYVQNIFNVIEKKNRYK